MENGLYSLRQFTCVRCTRYYYNNHVHTCKDISKSIIIIQKYWRRYLVQKKYSIYDYIYRPNGKLYNNLKNNFDISKLN